MVGFANEDLDAIHRAFVDREFDVCLDTDRDSPMSLKAGNMSRTSPQKRLVELCYFGLPKVASNGNLRRYKVRKQWVV